MATKQFKEIKNLSKDELVNKLRSTEAELFQARIKRSIGQLSDTASVWRLRKSVARMKTLMSQSASREGSK